MTNEKIERDTSNAVALGMVIGGMLGRVDEDEARSVRGELWTGEPVPVKPEAWRHIGWDQIVTDVDEAAAALDAYQATQPDDFWDATDWYLTLDKIAEDLWRDPREDWTNERIATCIVDL